MLYNKLEKYAEEFKNFAYICKFDRDTKTDGKESLYLTNSEPMFPLGSIRELFDEIEKRTGKESKVPFFIGYDSIPEFYPVESVRRSGWPAAAAIIPDKQIHSEFTRNPGTATRGRVDHDFSDPVMRKKISELKERIISGELLQVVLSRRFDLNDIDPFGLLQHFMEGDRSLYVYYFRLGEFEIVGSSPENIITRQGNELEVHPIAGTVPRGETDEEDMELAKKLLQDRKELREHRMLVDLARNDLGRISVPGSVKVVKSMEIQKFASVQHIVSTVQSELKEGVDNYRIIGTVFPAGTVSGAPKVRAIELIDRYEDVARGPYSGGVGIMSGDFLELALLIRSVFRNSREIYTQAGAGLVMDSDPEREVREFYSKATTVMGGLKSESFND